MNFLGHKNTKNTPKYVQIEGAMFKEESEDFTCKVATTIEEARECIESGFEYVCDFNNANLFRKRK